MKRTGLQLIVQRNGDGMGGRSLVVQPDMAPLLADHAISEMFERTDQTFGGYAPRQFQAASIGINSSLT